jgi:hypothetical protein
MASQMSNNEILKHLFNLGVDETIRGNEDRAHACALAHGIINDLLRYSEQPWHEPNYLWATRPLLKQGGN